MYLIRKTLFSISIAISMCILTACSSPTYEKKQNTQKMSGVSNANMLVTRLNEHQRAWKGTRYRIGGTNRQGIDCSAFMQITFKELFGISLPRTTIEQSQKGVKISKTDLKAGDLVFFKTGRGPNGKHVGVYVENGKFLHASTKGGVIYSDINSPYWSRVFWQGRRL